MPAPLNNTNASRDGVAPKIRVRLPSDAHVAAITSLFDTNQRGEVLWRAALQAADLVILDADGTLCHRDTGAVLPLAVEIWKAAPRAIAIATNQGGPACKAAGWDNPAKGRKYPTLAAVEEKYRHLADRLNAKLYMSLAYQTRDGEWIYPAGLERKDPRLQHEWRKPAPGMLIAAMSFYRATPGRTIFIGDSDEDEAAAVAAGVHFIRV